MEVCIILKDATRRQMRWITDCLTDMRQYVRLINCISDTMKNSDDTVIFGCIRDREEGEYRSLIADVVRWCGSKCLQLNTSKTKEIVVDLHRNKTTISTSVHTQG
ncbi:uncharacterized protein LOC113084562 [Tachysurus ichikawai]